MDYLKLDSCPSISRFQLLSQNPTDIHRHHHCHWALWGWSWISSDVFSHRFLLSDTTHWEKSDLPYLAACYPTKVWDLWLPWSVVYTLLGRSVNSSTILYNSSAINSTFSKSFSEVARLSKILIVPIVKLSWRKILEFPFNVKFSTLLQNTSPVVVVVIVAQKLQHLSELCLSKDFRCQKTPRSAGAAGSKGSSVTLETVIREGESIIHGKGRLMYHRDCQTDNDVSDTQPAVSYPLVLTHKARRSEHMRYEKQQGK